MNWTGTTRRERDDMKKDTSGAIRDGGVEYPYSDEMDGDGHQWNLPSYVEQWIANWNVDAQRRARHAEAVGRILEVLRPFGDRDGLRFLDLGCGWGNHSVALLKAFRGSSLVALDRSQAMLDRCQCALEPYGSRARLVRADLNDPGWSAELGEPFDVIISVQTLHHVVRSRLPGVYGDIAACLKQGGMFLNLDRFLPHLRARLVDRAMEIGFIHLLVERWFPRWNRGASGIQHRQLLRDAGFNVMVEQLIDSNGQAFAWLILCKPG